MQIQTKQINIDHTKGSRSKYEVKLRVTLRWAVSCPPHAATRRQWRGKRKVWCRGQSFNASCDGLEERSKSVGLLGKLVDGVALSTEGRVASLKRLKSGHEREPMVILRLGGHRKVSGNLLIAGRFLAHWSLTSDMLALWFPEIMYKKKCRSLFCNWLQLLDDKYTIWLVSLPLLIRFCICKREILWKSSVKPDE